MIEWARRRRRVGGWWVRFMGTSGDETVYLNSGPACSFPNRAEVPQRVGTLGSGSATVVGRLGKLS
ncbi:hypothetical protein [Phytoactinopolyspora mesophila]|uniref:Uncharacterized protein n=1 Tax=Phytoactinopolyspora mesophila TaxID=2650750 RepID=A0A7K3M418_9ACTN|nr:hypothetical protein [Phytoactinopolyspora mesophila]NDL57178.1 hypothetical protein [Phytoactinopolyspora mesophila]